MMTIVITFFAIPFGLFMIINERKSSHKYQEIFDHYHEYIRRHTELNASEKLAKLRAMLEHNYYHILTVDSHTVTAEKKIFSMGWLLFSTGFIYVGALVYLFYFFKFQKPHRVHFSLN